MPVDTYKIINLGKTWRFFKKNKRATRLQCSQVWTLSGSQGTIWRMSNDWHPWFRIMGSKSTYHSRELVLHYCHKTQKSLLGFIVPHRKEARQREQDTGSFHLTKSIRQGSSRNGENSKPTHPKWHTSSSKATVPKPTLTAPPTGNQVMKCLRLWTTFFIPAAAFHSLPP